MPKSAGRRNLRADSRAKQALAQIMAAWVRWVVAGLRQGLVIGATASVVQAGSVAHAVWVVGLFVGKEVARWVPGAVATVFIVTAFAIA